MSVGGSVDHNGIAANNGSNPSICNPGLSVIGSLIVANVTPGQTLTRTITMSIGSSDPATDLSVQVDGAAQSPQGTYMLLDAAHDTGQYSHAHSLLLTKVQFI